MADKKVIRHIIAGFFLMLFLAYYANVTLFEHCHVVNGVTIVHSHFHQQSHHSTPDGGHSGTSLTLIAALGEIQCQEAGDFTCDLTPYPVVCTLTAEVSFTETIPACIPHGNLRAPPALQ